MRREDRGGESICDVFSLGGRRERKKDSIRDNIGDIEIYLYTQPSRIIFRRVSIATLFVSDMIVSSHLSSKLLPT